jgi:four helix bundle protein
MTQEANKYDLEERTARFGESVILFCKSLQSDSILAPLVNQIVRSATSIGANYMEANGASSPRDFQNKVYICKKEAQETKHWLRMIAVHSDKRKTEIRLLWKEANELALIFNKITTTLKEKQLKIKSLKID